MGRYILRRCVISIPVLIGITLAVFIIANLAPGDPILALIDPEDAATLGEEWMEQQRRALGLDQPLPVRYGLWLKEAARGNLGYSYRDRQPIAGKIQERLWPTLKLMAAALGLAVFIAVPLGMMSAVKQYSKFDYASTIVAFGAVSIPNFFLGLGAIYLFAVILGWLPTAGMGTVGGTPSLLDAARHLILPASVLGLSQAAPLIRYVRSSMLETLRQDYVSVARAKGLREYKVIYRHALRNALIPVITVLALNLPQLVAGTVIVEAIFAWPGMGTLAIAAVRAYDYPMIMAINLIIGITILVSNLLADVLYAIVDPRIKYS